MTTIQEPTLASTTFAKELLTAVKDVWALMPTRTRVPILGGMHLHHADGLLEISGFDYETSVTKRVVYAGSPLPDLVVHGTGLKTVLAALDPKGSVELSVEGTQLVVQQGSKRAALKTFVLDDYPGLPNQTDSEKWFMFTGKRLQFIGSKVVPFAGKDNFLPVLTGVHLEVHESLLIASTTDRFRLAEAQFLVLHWTDDKAMLVPNLGKIANVFDPDDEITVSFGNDVVFLHSDNTTVSQRTLDGDFPKTSRLFPDETPIRTDFDGPAMLKALKFVETGIDTNGIVQVTVEPKLVRLSGSAGDDEIALSDTVPAEAWHGKDELETGFNPKSLADVLKVFGKETVSMSSTTSTKPSLFTARNVPNFRVLLMPRRLRS